MKYYKKPTLIKQPPQLLTARLRLSPTPMCLISTGFIFSINQAQKSSFRFPKIVLSISQSRPFDFLKSSFRFL